MRFFYFLSQSFNFSHLQNSQNYLKVKYPTVAMNKMTTMLSKGDDALMTNPNHSNLLYKLVPISKEESLKLNEKEIISYDYIKVNKYKWMLFFSFYHHYFRNWNLKRKNYIKN